MAMSSDAPLFMIGLFLLSMIWVVIHFCLRSLWRIEEILERIEPRQD
jgi:hypothetical protein